MAYRVTPEEPSSATKQRWATQIESTLAELHKAGVVWGDVKADNVLMDKEDSAWIIDFGGGYTRGWVDGGIGGDCRGGYARDGQD
jgi:Ser/Thr protein kinase RdoA (MazF antagonist)